MPGKFLPVEYPPPAVFSAPAPAGPYGTNLSVFLRTNPNGTWQLFARNDSGGTGSLTGWALTITTHSQVFSGLGGIVISNTAALGSPYPAIINVSKVANPITKVTATLAGLTHSFPSDLDILLVGPSGDAVMLMSDAGGGFGVTNLTLTFDDGALDTPPVAGPLHPAGSGPRISREPIHS